MSGDPISPYLFIKGIMIRQKEIKITQFADDTSIILNGTENSVQAALNVLE